MRQRFLLSLAISGFNPPYLVESLPSNIHTFSPHTITHGLEIVDADLRGVDFRRWVGSTDLYNCDLRGADFEKKSLRSLTIKDCNLSGARFEGARFHRVALYGCANYWEELRRGDLADNVRMDGVLIGDVQ